MSRDGWSCCISQILKRAWLLTHFDGAYLPPVCFVCAPSAPLCLCCRRVMRAQVRFRSSRTAMCNVPQPSQVSSMLSPSMNGLSPRWLVPVARMSPGVQRVNRGDPFNAARNLMRHVVRVEILHDNTVVCQPDLQLVGVLDLVGRDDIGADRRERVA